jgi:putative flippase GtrA
MTKAKLPDRETQVRFLRFLAVGGSAALLQFLVLALLRGRLSDMLAYQVSWLVSTALHYTLNRFWALPSGRQDVGRQLGEYLVTAAVSLGINTGAFWLCHDVIGLSLWWAAFFTIPSATIIVFLLLNYRVFRRSV